MGNLAIAYYFAGRPDDAVVQFLKMKEPWRTNLIAAYVSAGKLNEAQALMAEFRKDYPDYTLKDDAVWPTKVAAIALANKPARMAWAKGARRAGGMTRGWEGEQHVMQRRSIRRSGQPTMCHRIIECELLTGT